MFVDRKLNQYFNTNTKDKFMSRLLDLCQKSKYESIKLCHSPVYDESLEFAIESINEHISKRTGKVYVARNDLHQDRVKIGRTSKEISDREKTLNSAGVIGKIKIVWWDYSIDSILTEHFIHQRLKEDHLDREFFNLDVVSASMIIQECTDITYDFYNKIRKIYDAE